MEPEDVRQAEQHVPTGAEPDVRLSVLPGVWPHTVFARSPVAMAVVDRTGYVRAANPELARYLGRDVGNLVDTPMRRHAGPSHAAWELHDSTERRVRHADGHDLWAVVTAVPFPEAGAGASLVSFADATGRRDTERLLLHAAMHDSLTDLPNRRLLRDRLDTALARAVRTSARVAVLFVDLDRFKEVNDTWGHDVGDAVLVSVAAGIAGALRLGDTVARLGGDEFVVVCEDLDGDEDLDRLVGRLLHGIGRPVEVHGQHVLVSASIGVALAEAGAGEAEELMRRADLAMLQAKRHPGLPYVVAGAVPQVPSARPPDAVGLVTDLVSELRHALAGDRLVLHYQPVVRLDGRLMGLEALLRWPHPRLGTLAPADFLPLVVGTELAIELSDWVLRRAIRDAAGWADPGVRVSVNVWASQVARPGFAEQMAALLASAGLDARGLYLELHEQDLRDAGPSVIAGLRALKRMGVGLAIDDLGVAADASAGTPMTSAVTSETRPAPLRRMPVDTVKVSRAVVAGCVDDREDGVAVAAVAMAARAAGRHPLALGVETVEQLRLVRELDYGSVQGHLIGPPAALIDLRDVISARRITLPA